MTTGNESVDSTLAGLRAIRELLSDRKRWCRYDLAKTGNNRSVEVHAPEAKKFCVLGAAIRVQGKSAYTGDMHVLEAMRQAARALYGHGDLVTVNNFLGHAKTLAMIDLAISQTDISTPSQDHKNG